MSLPIVKTLHFQSDGPSTQYKNKTNFVLFNYFSRKLSLEHATWNFTAAGHGKSVADAIGAGVKEMCDRFVANGNDITCATDMSNFINKSESVIKCYIIKTEDISEIRKLLPEDLKAVEKTTKVHQVVWDKSEPNELLSVIWLVQMALQFILIIIICLKVKFHGQLKKMKSMTRLLIQMENYVRGGVMLKAYVSKSLCRNNRYHIPSEQMD